MNELTLLTLDADISFTYDARGRMVQTNEPLASARRPAPRLLLGRTGGGRVMRCGADLPDALVEPLAALEGDVDGIREALVPVTEEHDRLGHHVAVASADEDRSADCYGNGCHQ